MTIYEDNIGVLHVTDDSAARLCNLLLHQDEEASEKLQKTLEDASSYDYKPDGTIEIEVPNEREGNMEIMKQDVDTLLDFMKTSDGVTDRELLESGITDEKFNDIIYRSLQVYSKYLEVGSAVYEPKRYKEEGINKMVYKEFVKDLFSEDLLEDQDRYYVQCISADFGMGKGIAVEFNKRFDTKKSLQRDFPDMVNIWHKNGLTGICIPEGRVLNLVTKERYFHKPTYESITYTINRLRHVCDGLSIKKIAMPLIGCGLDGLEWDKVKNILLKAFEDSDIDIVVCKLEA